MGVVYPGAQNSNTVPTPVGIVAVILWCYLYPCYTACLLPLDSPLCDHLCACPRITRIGHSRRDLGIRISASDSLSESELHPVESVALDESESSVSAFALPTAAAPCLLVPLPPPLLPPLVPLTQLQALSDLVAAAVAFFLLCSSTFFAFSIAF